MSRTLVGVLIVVLGVAPIEAGFHSAQVAAAAAPTAPGAVATTAPGWVRPGVRLTYRGGQSTTGGEKPSSGAGPSQITVLAVSANRVLAHSEVFLDSGSGIVGGLSHASVGSHPTVDGEYWKHPTVLAAFATSAGVKVARGKYPLGRVTYDAVSIEVTSTGSVSRATYDSKSGVQLSATWEIQSGRETTRGYSQLESVRKLRWPWSDRDVEWKPTFRRLTVRGRTIYTTPGVGDFAIPIEATIDVGESGRDFATYLVTVAGQQPIRRGGGRGLLDEVWLPPAVLADLSPGQELDRDPRTGRTIRVSRVEPGSVTIEIAIAQAGEWKELTYERRSGIVVRAVSRVQNEFSIQLNETTAEVQS